MTLPPVDPAYRFRRAEDADLALIVPMWRSLLEFEAKLEPRFVPKPDAERAWLDELQADREAQRADIFLAEYEGKPVAFIHVRATRGAPFHQEERLGFIDSVWVEPGHRRRKVAERMISIAENWCRQRRLTLLEAGVVVRNTDAMKAWLALGFQTTSAVMTLRLAPLSTSDKPQAPSVLQLAKSVRRLVDFAQAPRGARVLDLAAHDGALLIAFGDAGATLRVGLYASLAEAKAGRPRGVQRVVAHAGSLPFVEERFTHVVERESLARAASTGGVLAEAARVLVPMGVFVAEEVVAHEDPARAREHDALARLADPNVAHVLQGSALKEATTRAGLAVEEALMVHEPRDLGGWLASAPPASREKLKDAARAFAERPEKDETGLGLRVVGHEIRFDQKRAIVRARKG